MHRQCTSDVESAQCRVQGALPVTFELEAIADGERQWLRARIFSQAPCARLVLLVYCLLVVACGRLGRSWAGARGSLFVARGAAHQSAMAAVWGCGRWLSLACIALSGVAMPGQPTRTRSARRPHPTTRPRDSPNVAQVAAHFLCVQAAEQPDNALQMTPARGRAAVLSRP